MNKNIDFVFIGNRVDFIASQEYFDIEWFKALLFDDNDLSNASEQEIALNKNACDIKNYFDENTLVIASRLSCRKDTIFEALDKGSHLFLIDYRDITTNDYIKLQQYNSKSKIAFYVPIFANSKAILLKKMMGMYATTQSLNIFINDPVDNILASDLFLLSLNLINKENIQNVEIQESSNSIKIIMEQYNITFTHKQKEYKSINGETSDKTWLFDWSVYGDFNSYHKNGIKENYSNIKENSKINIYKNIHLNYIGATKILYTTLTDLSLFMQIKDKFNAIDIDR